MYTHDAIKVKSPSIVEVTFKEFAVLARRRRWSAEALAARFRGQIPNPMDFFNCALSGRHPGVVVPYRSVIEFFQEQKSEQLTFPGAARHRACACGCGEIVFPGRKWSRPGCRTKARRAGVTDRQKGDRQALDFVEPKVRQNRGSATQVLSS